MQIVINTGRTNYIFLTVTRLFLKIRCMFSNDKLDLWIETLCFLLAIFRLNSHCQFQFCCPLLKW